ncbi:MAG: ABC transporter substrate-binding protein, partial [Bacteroidota bacterium]
GGLAYRFEILEEAVWDNGDPVLGSDYLFSIKAVMNPKTGAAAPIFRSYFKLIKAVEIDEDNPRRFTVIIAPAYFRGEYLAGGFGILPESVYDPEGLMREFSLADLNDPEKATQLAENNPNLQKFADAFNSDRYAREVISGAGAYRLASWESGQKLVLEKKEDWWGDALVADYPMLAAHPQRIVYRPIPDATATISLIRNQEIDVASTIPNTLFVDLQNDENLKANYRLLAPPSYLQNFITLNNRNAKLNDKRVRRALAHLLDIDEVIQTVKNGMASPILGPIPPSVDYYHKTLDPIRMDIEKAKQLLAEAGWKDTDNNGIVDKMIDGQKEELRLSYLMTPSNEVSTNIALIFQNGAKKAGVSIELEVQEANSSREKVKKRDFDMFTSATAPDPDYYDPHQNWHTSNDVPGGGNRSGFGNAQTDALIDELRTTIDKEKRMELFLRFQEVIYEEQPVIYLYNTKDCLILHKRLANAEPSLRVPGYFENFFELTTDY